MPAFDANNDGALIYLSFGSLGCGDTELLNRIIQVMGKLPYRVLVNIGEHPDAYHDLPPNVQVQEWFPQPSVIAKTDLVIHHGGNNTFTECLYFGKPAIIMPYVWDGHDNATRVQETGHGLKMHRSNWTDQELATNIERLLSADEVRHKLASTAAHMQSKLGTIKAARLLSELVTGEG